MEGLCTNCTKREHCRKLCDTAKDYANQDYKPQVELPMGTLPISIAGTEWDWTADQTYLSPRELEIITLFGSGLSRLEVCEVLNISRQSLRQHLHRIKDKVVDRG